MNWKVLLTVLFFCLASTATYGKASQSNQIEPVNFSNYLTVCDGCLQSGLTYAYTVPAGKRLVIEYISVEVDNIAVGDSVDVSVYTTVGTEGVRHYLGVAEPIVRSKIDNFSNPYRSVSRQVKIYADPETPVSLHANRLSRDGETLVRFSFSGYLEKTK